MMRFMKFVVLVMGSLALYLALGGCAQNKTIREAPEQGEETNEQGPRPPPGPK